MPFCAYGREEEMVVVNPEVPHLEDDSTLRMDRVR